MVTLKEDLVQKIKQYFPSFYKFLESEIGKRWLEEREERVKEFSRLLSKDSLKRLTEADFIKIMSELWANLGWTNKQYPAERVLSNISINELRNHLYNLLWSDKPLSQRYDEFKKAVKGMGSAQITEILAFVNPNEYGIWNRRSREALGILGFENIIPINKYDISGKEYERFNSILKKIMSILKGDGLTAPNMLDVDLFLYYVVTVTGKPKRIGIEEEEFDHDEIKDMLLQIGQGLGFEVNSEFLLAPGARVDAVWRAKIGNLGEIKYVFEVHKKGSVDSLLINLLKASSDPAVHKVIAVSDEKRLDEIQKKASDFLGLTKKLVLWPVAEVRRTADLLEELKEITKKLGFAEG